MHTRTSGTSLQERPNDVGTLWILRRNARTARCALMDCQGAWEARVIVDREVVDAERCDRPAEAFAIAERWKARMLEEGWRQIGRVTGTPSSRRKGSDAQPSEAASA
jgi:hypothetical protein